MCPLGRLAIVASVLAVVVVGGVVTPAFADDPPPADPPAAPAPVAPVPPITAVDIPPLYSPPLDPPPIPQMPEPDPSDQATSTVPPRVVVPFTPGETGFPALTQAQGSWLDTYVNDPKGPHVVLLATAPDGSVMMRPTDSAEGSWVPIGSAVVGGHGALPIGAQEATWLASRAKGRAVAPASSGAQVSGNTRVSGNNGGGSGR